MLLRDLNSGDLVEVLDRSALVNPFADNVMVQFQCGQDLPAPELCNKTQLVFPSGEQLPQCWRNALYRE